jgi:AsmA protein
MSLKRQTFPNGVVNNQDFNLQSPLLRVTGAGKADLVKENLDYLLKASIVGSLQGQGGEDLKKLKGVTIPVRVTGPFDNPSYKPDLSAALSDTVKQKAKEKVEEQKEEVQQKLQDKLKGKLKGLF